jgi:hypothetical protein
MCHVLVGVAKVSLLRGGLSKDFGPGADDGKISQRLGSWDGKTHGDTWRWLLNTWRWLEGLKA